MRRILGRRRQGAGAIVNDYEHTPPSDTEQASAIASLRDAIAEEPW